MLPAGLRAGPALTPRVQGACHLWQVLPLRHERLARAGFHGTLAVSSRLLVGMPQVQIDYFLAIKTSSL